MAGLHALAAIDAHFAAQHHQHQVVAGRHIQIGARTAVEHDIPHIKLGEGFGCAIGVAEAAGDNAGMAGIIGQRHHGDVVFGQVLVAGGRFFVFGRQVYPQLRHFKFAAAFAKRFGVEFFVHNAGAGGHPLHIALADHAAAAGGIAVRHFALIGDGHGFKAAVRVGAHATRCAVVGRESVRHGIVKHQKRAGLFVFAHVGKQRGHIKAVAHPMFGGGVVDFADGSHDGSFILFK